MDMHFKLGLYEHQSSSAIEGLLYLLSKDPKSIIPDGNHQNIERIKITSYEPALGIIGDPAKKNPLTRQTADHSMVYIISTLLRKACEKYENILDDQSLEDLWKYLMLTPFDYSKNALFSETTRAIMEKIEFQHGGLEYD